MVISIEFVDIAVEDELYIRLLTYIEYWLVVDMVMIDDMMT